MINSNRQTAMVVSYCMVVSRDFANRRSDSRLRKTDQGDELEYSEDSQSRPDVSPLV